MCRVHGNMFWNSLKGLHRQLAPLLGKEGVVVLVGRSRRARRHAQTGVGGLSETALPYPWIPPEGAKKWENAACGHAAYNDFKERATLL